VTARVLAIALLVGVGAWVLGRAAIAGLLPPCPTHALTGWHCPGCGTGRALAALTQGHVRAALVANPLLPVLLPVVGALALGELRARRRGSSLIVPRRVVRGLLAGVGLFTVLRNVPGIPFLGP
jgi:hypothetical protein